MQGRTIKILCNLERMGKLNSLYIIGNGFDLHHGFNTRYSNFSEYLQVHNPDLLDLIHCYYYQENGVDLWASFEESLANFDKDALLVDLSDYLPVISSDEFRDRDWNSYAIEVKNKVGLLTHGLCAEFRNFILSATSEMRVDSKFKLALQPHAKYLSFNYSDTLEKHYSVPESNITYIHGRASDFSAPLILGHGIDPSEFKVAPSKPPENLSPEDLERWLEYMSDSFDYAYELGLEEVYDYYVSSFKNAASIIKSHSCFFTSLDSIENVFVLGHSLSEVDLPYFQEISAHLPEHCQWYVSFRGEIEYIEKQETIQKLGVPKKLVNMIDFCYMV